MVKSRQKILKIISGLLTGLIFLVAVFIFICPMGSISTAAVDSSPGISALCAGHSTGSTLLGGMGTTSNCFGFHLSIIEQFTNALFEKVNISFLVLFAVFGTCSLIFQTSLYGALQLRFTRFRKHFYEYFKIRHQSRKKFLGWLLFVNSYSI